MHKPEPTVSQSPRVDLASESVAGEEDPGASTDLSMDPPAGAGASGRPAGDGDAVGNSAVGKRPPGVTQAAHPGDEAPPGTPGTGEAVCPECGGTGRVASGACPECGGTGKVNLGIGGG